MSEDLNPNTPEEKIARLQQQLEEVMVEIQGRTDRLNTNNLGFVVRIHQKFDAAFQEALQSGVFDLTHEDAAQIAKVAEQGNAKAVEQIYRFISPEEQRKYNASVEAGNSEIRRDAWFDGESYESAATNVKENVKSLAKNDDLVAEILAEIMMPPPPPPIILTSFNRIRGQFNKRWHDVKWFFVRYGRRIKFCYQVMTAKVENHAKE